MAFPISFANIRGSHSIFHRPKPSNYILAHGDLLQHYTPSQGLKTTSLSDAITQLQSDKNTTLLLAAPFVISFVHETIKLSPAELKQVSDQTLLLDLHPEAYCQVDSIQLSDNRAATVHSCLTETGRKLIQSLGLNRNASWQPAIYFFVHEQVVHNAAGGGSAEEIIQIFLSEEALQIHQTGLQPRFLLLRYWNSDSDIEKQQQQATHLFQSDSPGCASRVFDVTQKTKTTGADVSQHVFEPIFGGGDATSRPNPKIAHLTLNAEPSRYRFLWAPGPILTLVSILVVVWMISVKMTLSSHIADYHAIQKSIQQYQAQSERIAALIKIEQEFHRFQSLRETIRSQRYDPQLFFQKLDPLLPDGVNLLTATVSPAEIMIELLDDQNINISKLMDRLTEHFGKPDLISNDAVSLENQAFKKYRLIFSHPPQDLLYVGK